MLRIILVLFLCLCLLCSGCTYLFSTAYGFKSPKKLNSDQIADQARKYNIPAENSFELDITFFFGYLKSFDTIQYREQVKNHYQPLQALYFDKHGQLQNFHINCYAGGFPNMQWNRNGNFETFPPKPQAPVDTLVSYQTLSRYLKPLSGTKPITVLADDYTVVVFWSRVMGRQSKRLIQSVQQNTAKSGNQKIRLIYVNNDDLMAEFWK
ncbi:hypothetical protein [Adhaeribacter terreus]|uniref:Uncharacterized protein n=1 Tax=Adhaeribacter terreus TaxID=529703 RepID=A0ABW0EDL0_9BACT